MFCFTVFHKVVNRAVIGDRAVTKVEGLVIRASRSVLIGGDCQIGEAAAVIDIVVNDGVVSGAPVGGCSQAKLFNRVHANRPLCALLVRTL